MFRRAWAMLGVTTVAAAALAIGASSADAVTPHIQQVTGAGSTAPTQQQYTIRYRDSAGHITRVWHGSQAAAAAQGVHPQIVKTASCHLPTTYWVFRNSGLTCFAYSGSMNINITGVYEVDSGNNAGYYRIGSTNYSLEHYTSDLWAAGQTVTLIHIN